MITVTLLRGVSPWAINARYRAESAEVREARVPDSARGEAGS